LKASVDPNAADPQMQMLVGLRAPLRSSNTLPPTPNLEPLASNPKPLASSR